MSTVPSLKATVFQFMADELAEALRSGRLSQAELERRLAPDDLQYLGKTLGASTWIPIATSSRVLTLLFELSGGPDIRAFMRERGRSSAYKLRDGGIYNQLRIPATSTTESLERSGRIIVTLSAVMFNFSSWRFETGTPN